jgi:tRNA-splicing ligase RtcB (3'-phosphate/5'-hydroxy nucleic acid ligase)
VWDGCLYAPASWLSSYLIHSLGRLRIAIENAVPHGGPGVRGTWAEVGRYGPPNSVSELFMSQLSDGYRRVVDRHPKVKGKQDTNLS